VCSDTEDFGIGRGSEGVDEDGGCGELCEEQESVEDRITERERQGVGGAEDITGSAERCEGQEQEPDNEGAVEVCPEGEKQRNGKPRGTETHGTIDNPAEEQAEEEEGKELGSEDGEFVSIDVMKGSDGKEAGKCRAGVPKYCNGNREEAQCSEECGGELEACESGLFFDGSECDFGEPWQVDHAHTFTDGKQGFGAWNGFQAENMTAVIEVIPDIGMPEWESREIEEDESSGSEEQWHAGGPAEPAMEAGRGGLCDRSCRDGGCWSVI
jgi:hypothetical protein